MLNTLTNKKNKYMYNRTFKKNVQYEIASIKDGDIKITSLNNQKECKKYIYSNGNRGEQYSVTEYYTNKQTKQIVITKMWIYKFTKEGPIFTKEIFSLLKEQKINAMKNQLNMFINN